MSMMFANGESPSNVTVVFDGHESEAQSIKQHCHLKRNPNVGLQLSFRASSKMTAKKTFLPNQVNKQAFVDLLAHHVRQAGSQVVQCKDHADVTIATTSMDLTEAGNKVLLRGNDTDLFAFMLHHLSEMNREETPRIWFYRPSSDSTIDLTTLSKYMDPQILTLFLPLHAFSSCDTKSPFYNLGKKRLIQRLQLRPTEVRHS